MGYVNKDITLLVIGVLFMIMGCASSSSTSQSDRKSAAEGSEYMTLEDHIRRINGVRITGSGDYAKVVLRPRGFSSASRGMGAPDDKTDMNIGDSNDRQPLFVVDGQKAGRDYPSVKEMFSEGEIKSVQLLPESEASRYGSEGGFGVIEIVTKSSADNK